MPRTTSKKRNYKTERLEVLLPAKMKRDLERVSDQLAQSQGALIRRAVLEFIDSQKKRMA